MNRILPFQFLKPLIPLSQELQISIRSVFASSKKIERVKMLPLPKNDQALILQIRLREST